MAEDGLTVPERLAMVQVDYMATQIEFTDNVLRVLVAAHSSPGTEIHENIRIPRLLKAAAAPVEPPPQRRGVSLAEAFGMVETMLNP